MLSKAGKMGESTRPSLIHGAKCENGLGWTNPYSIETIFI